MDTEHRGRLKISGMDQKNIASVYFTFTKKVTPGNELRNDPPGDLMLQRELSIF